MQDFGGFMKYLTDKKIALIIIAACLLILLHSKTADRNDEIVEDVYTEKAVKSAENPVEPANLSPLRPNERVIYTCRLADEEIPAVQISEVTDQNGRATAIVLRAAVGAGIEKAIQGTGADWDYKSIAARAGDKTIDIAYKPAGAPRDYDWVLTVSDHESFFRERVRDCMEISDE